MVAPGVVDGWKCPRCKACWSPGVAMCTNPGCAPVVRTESRCDHDWDRTDTVVKCRKCGILELFVSPK